MPQELLHRLDELLGSVQDISRKNDLMNQLKIIMHHHSPFRHEPVDCVLWVKAREVTASDYHPGVMAPAEKQLLQRSLEQDGFTQPIVTAQVEDGYLVIDGYHRQLLGKKVLKDRLHGYLPVTIVNGATSQGVAERMATTVRHNRARANPAVLSVSEIVRDLSRLGWSDDRISRELGMEADEILRLKQLTGLPELFSGERFSDAWTVK
ncbi:TPA: ParB N-terminal domain-containing protein [Citrobacter freundii]|nr:ParB N-terminal domain-containing protein [Citrobacter freundii]